MGTSPRPSTAAPYTAVRQSDRLFHDIFMPTETAVVRQRARVVAEQIAPLAQSIGSAEESVANFPWTAFGLMADGGLFAVPFAEGYGEGLTNPAVATAVTIEELAYVSSSMAAVFDVHCILAGNALTHASAALKDRWLRPLVKGQVVGSFATTEPGASSDLSPSALRTRATETDGGWVINGCKRFISNSPVADFVVVLCGTGNRTTAFLVELKNTAGVTVGRPDRKMGNRGQLTADIVFENVEVTSDDVVGDVGGGLTVALSTLTFGRIGIAAAGVGMAQAAFDIAVDHLQTRRVFGQTLGSFQHWQFKLAERATEIENARSLYQKAAYRLDLGIGSPEPEAAMAKHYGTALSVDMARDAVQILGGYGFIRELGSTRETYRLEEIYRDSKIGEIYEGANEIQKWIIARMILGRSVAG